MSQVILAVLVGLGVGVVVGALGAGGGIISVPVLVYLLGQEPHDAAAGSLVIVGVSACVGLVEHARRRAVAWRQGAVFGVLGVLGSFLGSRASHLVAPDVLMAAFAVLLGVVGITMALRAKRMRHPSPQSSGEAGWPTTIALATLTGALTGFFGVGGGFIIVPILVLVMNMPIHLAAGTSLVVMAISSATGLVSRIGTGVSIDWAVIAAFTVASSIGSLAGGPVSTRVKPWVLTACFAVLLLCVAIAIAAQLMILR